MSGEATGEDECSGDRVRAAGMVAGAAGGVEPAERDGAAEQRAGGEGVEADGVGAGADVQRCAGHVGGAAALGETAGAADTDLEEADDGKMAGAAERVGPGR